MKAINKKGDAIFMRDHKWHLAVTRNMSFWHQTISSEGHRHNMVDFGVKASLEQMAVVVDGTETHIFHYEPGYSNYMTAVLAAITNKAKLESLKIKYKRHARELLRALAFCRRQLTLARWNDFVSQYRRFCPSLMITATIGRSGGQLLADKLKEYGFSQAEIPEWVATITYPKTHTPLFASRLELLKIGAKKQNKQWRSNQVEAELKKWLQVYGSMPVNFCEDPWTIKDARQQLKAVLFKDCQKESELAKLAHRERVKTAELWRRKIKSQDIKILAIALAEATYLNEFRKGVFCRVSLNFRPIFKKITNQGGSNNWRDLFYLHHQEATAIVAGKKIHIPELVAQRKVVGFYPIKNGDFNFLKIAEARKLAAYVHSLHGNIKDIEPTQSAAVRGISVNQGVARGIARIILSAKDFFKLKPGEILVTTMTSVDFIPVMERAAAFVTNEGGITSHASIIAREMNKPAIIGTRIATQVLRDGDLIEVDAEKGIVRKL